MGRVSEHIAKRNSSAKKAAYKELSSLNVEIQDEIAFDWLQHYYVIEFEHLREFGQKFWCERSFKDVLFSKVMTRY